MQRLLLLLSIIVCTLAGWRLGARTATRPVTSSPPAAAIAPIESGFNAPERTIPQGDAVRQSFARLLKAFPEDHQSLDVAAQLSAEFNRLPSDEMPSILAFLGSDTRGSFIVNLLAGFWAERDPATARKWLLGANNWGMASAMFETWIEQDRTGIGQWIEAHVDELGSTTKQAAAMALAKSPLLGSPDDSLRLMEKLGHRAFASRLFSAWANQEPEAAAERALAEPTPELRADAVWTVVGQWALQNPDAARAWVEQLADPVLVDQNLAGIGSWLRNGDPLKSADFLAGIPQTNIARESLGVTLAQWKRADLSAPIAWAANLEDHSPPDQRALVEEWREELAPAPAIPKPDSPR